MCVCVYILCTFDTLTATSWLKENDTCLPAALRLYNSNCTKNAVATPPANSAAGVAHTSQDVADLAWSSRHGAKISGWKVFECPVHVKLPLLVCMYVYVCVCVCVGFDVLFFPLCSWSGKHATLMRYCESDKYPREQFGPQRPHAGRKGAFLFLFCAVANMCHHFISWPCEGEEGKNENDGGIGQHANLDVQIVMIMRTHGGHFEPCYVGIKYGQGDFWCCSCQQVIPCMHSSALAARTVLRLGTFSCH